MADKIFVDGMYFKRPSPQAPEWIKGGISIEVKRFKEFMKRHEGRDYLNIDLKKSKDGNLYLELNTYQKPAEKPQETDDGTGIPF